VSATFVWSTSSSFKVTSGSTMTVTAPKHSTAGTGGHITVKATGGSSSATNAALYSYT
jgi:hypothetical protein